MKQQGWQDPLGYASESSLQWLACPDGKIRPVESAFHSVANGVQYRTFGRPYYADGEIDAPTPERSTLKELQILWGSIAPKEIQWPIRGFKCFPETGTLQPILRKQPNRNKGEKLLQASAEVQKAFLRGLPELEESTCPPHRQRYYEQRPAKLEDFMRFVPSKTPLGKGRKQKTQAEEILQSLLATGKGFGVLPETLPASEEAWLSLPYETQDFLWNVFSRSAGLESSATPLLCDGLPARIRKAALHGFGNAIVPEVAAEFMKASF